MPMGPPLLFVSLLEIAWAIPISRPAEFDRDLAELTKEVIGRHLAGFRCLTYVLEKKLEADFVRGIPSIVVRWPAERRTLTESFEQGCGGFIVRVGDKAAAARLLIDAKHGATGSRYNNQRYLFLPVDAGDVGLELPKDPKLFFLPNLVVISPGNGTLSAITHTVFDHHKRELLGIAHEVLDVWAPGKGFTFAGDLFPDKISDVKGKKFVFALLNYSPFSLVKKEGDATVFDGFETRIAAEFVRSVNGTWEGLDHPEELWGEVFPNGTGTGVVGSVIDHAADFGYSAFYQWFCDDCDCSYPCYQSGVTCLVPRPALLSGWLTIVLPFETKTWEVLICVYFLSSAFLLALILTLQHLKGFQIKDQLGMAASDSFFTNFRLQLEQIPAIPPTQQPLSVYVKIIVYYYFFVAAFWQGGISSILTVPRYEEPINEVIDLIGGWPKLKWGGNSNAWVNSIRASTDPNLVQVVEKFVVQDDETLHRKTRTRDFGFFIERLPHGHFGFSDYITEDSMKYLRMMEKDIYTAFGVFILPRGSPYSEKFDQTVLRLYDSGIIHKLEVQVSLERINNRLQNMIEFSNAKDTSTVTLAIRHIQGPIYIYLGGMTLASFAFLLELFISRKTPRRRATPPEGAASSPGRVPFSGGFGGGRKAPWTSPPRRPIDQNQGWTTKE